MESFSELHRISLELIGNLISFVKLRLINYKVIEDLQKNVNKTFLELTNTFSELNVKLGE